MKNNKVKCFMINYVNHTDLAKKICLNFAIDSKETFGFQLANNSKIEIQFK